MKIKDLVIISILTTILFVVEQVLTFIPNVQLTFLLIIVYSKVLKTKKTLFIILIHVLIDNLFMGTFNIVFIPFMYMGYIIIPITLNTIFKNIDNEIKIALLSIIYSIIYCTIFVIPNSIVYGINLIDYLVADLPFALILSISSFISILWLYKPLNKKLTELINKNDSE
ncbi:MAG: hypothetical protein R3Y60_05355 [bacterium]